MFLYLMLNKLNYKKSQLNQYFKNKTQLKIKNLTLNEGKNMHSLVTKWWSDKVEVACGVGDEARVVPRDGSYRVAEGERA